MRLLAGGAPVWVILDELPTLNKLPKLPEALAVARKPNVRLVIGLQGRAQLEARYDKEAEAMLSQPATKVFLRTSEPRAAEWISKALGEIEFERLRESVNQDVLFAGYRRKSHNFSLDRQVKPLVLPSEIMGLKNLTGYLKSGNHIVRIRFRTESRAAASAGIRPSSDQGRRASRRETNSINSSHPLCRLPKGIVFSRVATRQVHGHAEAAVARDSVLRLMLTISRPLSSGQAQKYHAEEFTSRAQSYYAEGRERSRGVARPSRLGPRAEGRSSRGRLRSDV